jgi:urease accessory protein
MNELLRIERHLPAPHGLAPSLLARAAVLSLPYAERCRSRLRTALADGREVALFLPRGSVLHGGDALVVETGELIRIEARPQALAEARSDQPHTLLRAAYHLGNRHIPVELGTGYLRIEADGVLEDLLASLGLHVLRGAWPFEPEAGAYAGGHRHGHEESFHEDHALARATYVLYEPRAGSNPVQHRPTPLHLTPHDPSHDHRHEHPHHHVHAEPEDGLHD